MVNFVEILISATATTPPNSYNPVSLLLYLMRTAALLDIVDLYNRSTTLLTYAIGQLYPEEQQSAITVGPIVMAWFKLAIE